MRARDMPASAISFGCGPNSSRWSLVRDIDKDVARRSLASAFERFGHDTGSVVIAEGVETQQELQALEELGIGKAQGYYLYKPQARDAVPGVITGSGRQRTWMNSEYG